MRIFGIIILILFSGFYFISQTETFKYFKKYSVDEINAQFELIDMNNNSISNNDLLGKKYVVGFGYTNCIDVCPVTLATLTGILETLEQRYGKQTANQYNAVFITVDPTRDKPEILKDFIDGVFHERIIALTGTQQQIDKMGDNFNIEYSKYGDIQNNLYTMLHPTFLYVIDENGKYVMEFSHTIKPELAVDLMAKKFKIK